MLVKTYLSCFVLDDSAKVDHSDWIFIRAVLIYIQYYKLKIAIEKCASNLIISFHPVIMFCVYLCSN